MLILQVFCLSYSFSNKSQKLICSYTELNHTQFPCTFCGHAKKSGIQDNLDTSFARNVDGESYVEGGWVPHMTTITIIPI